MPGPVPRLRRGSGQALARRYQRSGALRTQRLLNDIDLGAAAIEDPLPYCNVEHQGVFGGPFRCTRIVCLLAGWLRAHCGP